MNDTATPPVNKPEGKPRRRWLRWLALSPLVVLLLIALAAAWLLGTGSGLRFALARAAAATHGALSVQQAHGRLLGPLDLRDVRYKDGKGTDIRLASAHLEIAVWPLLRKRLHVLDLQADDIQVELPPSPQTNTDQSTGFQLQPPLDVQLDHVRVGKLAIRQAGQPLFTSNRLDLAGSWTSNGLTLTKLALDAPDGRATLSGKLAIGDNYRGNGKATFAWTTGGTAYSGSLIGHGDGSKAHLELTLTAPTQASLQLDLQQSGKYPWTARLVAPRFDPKPLLGESSLKSLALSLQGSGDQRGGSVNGSVDLNDYRLLLKPLRAHFTDDFKTLQLDQLSLGSPQVKGSMIANGVVQISATPITANLAINWQDLQLPADLAGQLLNSHGKLKASGSAENFHAEGDLAIGPPGKLAALALNLDGTPQQITLHTLDLKQANGGMQAKGVLTLQPVFGWQIEAVADNLDPGRLLVSWNGALNFDIASNGQLPQEGPDATLEIRKLNGTLRKRAVRGSGKLHLSSNKVVDGKLDLASGGSTIRLDAKPGATNDAELTLAIASLGDWLPEAGGRLNGHFTIGGKLPALSVNGTLDGQALSYQQQQADQLALIVGVPDISHPGGKLDLKTRGVSVDGLAFRTVDLLAEGSEATHRLTLDANGKQLSAALRLDGSLRDGKWKGTLSTLNLQPQAIPGWRLQQPSQLTYVNGAMTMSELCLTAGDPVLCVTGSQDKAGNLDATYRLRQVPLTLLMTAFASADVPLRADGILQGDGGVHRSAAGVLSGNASITSANGRITYNDRPDQPLVSYDNLSLMAKLDPAGEQITLRTDLDGSGTIHGQLGISGAKQVLDGQLSLRIDNLAFLELLTSELAQVKGSANGDFNIGGTLAQPAIIGQAALESFAAEVPKAGLKLTSGHIVLATSDAKVFRIDGTVTSGKGSLALNGTAGIATDAPTSITVKGSQFTAADIPSAKVVISPDLTIKQSKQGIDIGGSVGLDSADVNLEKLPGAGATRVSPDVVVIDEKQQQTNQQKLPVTAVVTVNLGEKTHVVGMGLDGTVRGRLVVSERPGKATTGQGQVAVSGTYKAYGQNLHIERGQLLFASTPIDNPGLNIRAARNLQPNATIDEGQRVGLDISGTAQRPVLTVFSNPVMEQSDALSYLITGKPLSQVKGGEGNMVSAAAQALGSAGGDLLAKRIGSHLGVDDIGVSSSDALGGSSAFTVGKYLSPRLYLSYGIGLFDPGQVITLRYLISNRWNFEAQNATDFSRASFNYRLEK
jgi:translocation and assembly module TamB